MTCAPTGMFDWVVCEAPLPDGFKGELRTKSIDLQPGGRLRTYRIAPDGRLLQETYVLHRIPREKWRFGWGPPFRHETTGWREVPFDGVIRLYGWGQDADDWQEYEARFRGGRLDGQIVAV